MQKVAVRGNINSFVRLKVKGRSVPKGEGDTAACGETLYLNALVCILAVMLLCHVSMLMQRV